MEWISYPERKPEQSGPYVVSIQRPYNNSDLTFKYVAYFNADSNEWFKYNPFEDENGILEKIDFRINGWGQVPIYLR